MSLIVRWRVTTVWCVAVGRVVFRGQCQSASNSGDEGPSGHWFGEHSVGSACFEAIDVLGQSIASDA